MSANTDASPMQKSPVPDAGTTPSNVHEARIGQSWTMREAAEATGVSLDTIKRRRRDGAFPGAAKVDGAWRIPSAELAKVATEEQWVVHLPGAPHDADPVQAQSTAQGPHDAVPGASIEQLHAAELKQAALTAERDRIVDDLARVTAERDRARSDLEHERSELSQLRVEKSDVEKSAAVAEALAAERAEQVAKGDEREQQLQRDLVAERARADGLADSLGWRARRRLRKTPDA